MKKKNTIPLIISSVAGAFAAVWIIFGLSNLNSAKRENAEVIETQAPVKNIIFLIGDGMGLVQVNAAMLSHAEPLAIERAQFVGLQKTYSATNKVTDSAASGTALATGTKTYNGAIGVGPDTARLTSVLEKAAAKGLSTGLVATYRITHATPAAFIGHVPHRDMEEQIATDFLKTDITLFIGGGRNQFEQRRDGQNLSDSLKAKGYQVVYTPEALDSIESGKVAALLADSHLPDILGGRDSLYLSTSTAKALDILSQNDNGFFLMIEGSMIDGGGHDNNIDKVIAEALDFDRAVAEAFDFADRHPGTLVVVTADHETGGLTLPENGNGVEYLFSTGNHTGSMVPVYSYGAYAGCFTGIMENTDIPTRMAELLGL
ncbi:MAG: alkaline phosphatase [Rikenellaceae bacterium]|jgi:alkaline phosphatase|nr:alkaline phosphatase [Rikenellaceae bacterium]